MKEDFDFSEFESSFATDNSVADKDSKELEKYKISVEDNKHNVNMNGKTVQQILNLSDRFNKIKLSHNSIKHIDIEKEIFTDILDESDSAED